MAGINELIQRLERLGAEQVKHKICSKVADAAHAECIRGFREQRNPYGVPWAPRKDPRGAWPILDKTGRGVNSLSSRASGDRITMRIIGYMKFHQVGTHSMVARMIFPDPDRGLGTWREPIENAALEAVRELMRGGTA